MSQDSFIIYRSPGEKVQQGLSYKILELLRKKGSLTQEEVCNSVSNNWFTIKDTFNSLLKRNFIFRVNDTYYFSPNAVLITTQRLSSIPLIQGGK